MDDKNTAYLTALAGLGAQPNPVTRDEALLNAIADRLDAIEEGGGGGSDLPAVTSADNGKVLGVVGGEWDKMDKGWNFTETQLFSETATTEAVPDFEFYGARLTYDQFIDAPGLAVTFDGVTYECERVDVWGDSSTFLYGAPRTDEGYDFSEYPFSVESESTSDGSIYNSLYTGNAGTYTISAAMRTPIVSPDFGMVLDSAAQNMFFRIISGVTTYAEARNAFYQGKIVYISADQGQRVYVLYVGAYSLGDGFIVRGVTLDASSDPSYYNLMANTEDDILR